MATVLNRRAFVGITAGLLGSSMLSGRAFAQASYPDHALTNIIPYNPGGMSDSISRIVGEKITELTGQTVINDYRPGAGGAIAANYYVGTEPDGYTLMQSTNSFYAIIPKVTKVEFNPDTDLTPLVLVGDSPMVISIHPSIPATTLQELIDYAKANPDAISYGTSGRGTVGHLCGEWLALRAGISLLHIPYNNTPEALQAALSGEVQMVFGPESAEHALAGSLKAIAVMGDKRWVNLPDVPTTIESGIEGWAPRSWHTLSILSAVPDDIKIELNRLINQILDMPDVKERLVGLGLIPGIEDLAAVRQRATDDAVEFGKIIEEAGLQSPA